MKKILQLFVLLNTCFVNAQNVGINAPNPTRGKLVVRGTVGAVSAIFGDTTTGIAIENNYPGIGFNSYYDNGRKVIAPGFGALISQNPGTGVFSVFTAPSAIAVSGNSIPLTERLVILPGGNVGIGVTAPAAKLDIAGNIRIADGTQGAGKTLTSDANGNASWTAAPGLSSTGFRSVVINSNINTLPSGEQIFMTLSPSGTTGFVNGTAYYDRYVVPQTGVYHFDVQLSATFASAPTIEGALTISIIQNLGLVAAHQQNISAKPLGNFIQDFAFSFMLQLTAGEQIRMAVTQRSGVEVKFVEGVRTFMSGYRVY